MNKFKTLTMILVMALFAACSSDDDKDEGFVDGGAADIVGTYSGSLAGKVGSVDISFDGKYDLVLSRQKDDDDEVTVVLPACSFENPGMPNLEAIPAVAVPDVEVEYSTTDAGVYTFEEDNYEVVINGVTYKGRINGKIAGANIQVNYTMTPGRMPMPINFTFTGTLK